MISVTSNDDNANTSVSARNKLPSFNLDEGVCGCVSAGGECEEETASHINGEIMRPIRHGGKHVARRSLPSEVKDKEEKARGGTVL